MEDEIQVPDLYRLAFMPGAFKCPTCGFQLSKQTISVATGQIGTTEDNRESEPCPNDGTVMVHVTYREVLEDYSARLTEKFNQIERLQREYLELAERSQNWKTHIAVQNIQLADLQRDNAELREKLGIARLAEQFQAAIWRVTTPGEPDQCILTLKKLGAQEAEAKLAAAEAAQLNLYNAVAICRAYLISGRHDGKRVHLGAAIKATDILAAIDAAKTGAKAKHPEGLCGH